MEITIVKQHLFIQLHKWESLKQDLGENDEIPESAEQELTGTPLKVSVLHIPLKLECGQGECPLWDL